MLQAELNPTTSSTCVHPNPVRTKSPARGIVWLFAILVGIAPCASTLEPNTSLAGYGRQSWVIENGLPQNTVQALAQTRDGFLWLGTEVGLVRFDGNNFVLFDQNSKLGVSNGRSSPLWKSALPGNDVQCLLATADGALWIGTTEGLTRYKNDELQTYTTANGLPSNRVEALVETKDGEVWVSTSGGLVHFSGTGFSDTALGKPKGTVNAMTLGPYGELWTGAADGLYQNWRGKWSGPKFVSMFPGTGPRFLQTLDSGWLAADNSTIRQSDHGVEVARLSVGHELPGTRIQAIFLDHNRILWVGTNSGLVRVHPGSNRSVRGYGERISFERTAPTIDKLSLTDPLATASILSILEDREGNLWVGTETGGLHILRDERFRTLGARDGLSSDATTTVVEDNVGTLWVGTSGYGLNATTRSGTAFGKTTPYTARDGLTSDIILSLAAAPDGDLWAGTPDGLNRIRKSAITAYTTADGLPDDFIRSLLVDADGSLWIGTRRGLAHMNVSAAKPHIETFTQSTGLGSDLVGAMARDTDGNLWVATLAGLSRLSGGAKITNFTSANGLSSNIITSLLARGNGTLIIGTQGHGWNLWDGQRFSSVGGGTGLNQTTIHAVLDDGNGHFWFATGNGIARCDCEIEGGCSHWMEFGAADGLRTREMATNSHPTAWRSADGLLWFATPKGLVQVDPAHFPINNVPPPVALVRFAADDVDQPLNDNALKVPAGHNHFQFDYAGLSFTSPQKVRYRYMLEGFDHQWTDADARRSAYYTNIPPGNYTFRVQAANNDGVWNTEGAALAFTLQPHFYQNIWFYVLLALMAAGLILLLLRLRLLRAQREFSAVLAERNRIAREVHDTLAQGYVGVSVQLEVLAELLRHKNVDAAVQQLDTARQHVREGLGEARQSIWALRSQDIGEYTLPVKLRRATEHANGHGVEATFSLYGAYRPMPAEMERELLRVGQEAIHNVKKHSGARHMSVQLEYGPAEIALVVRDDGRGFEAGNGAYSPPGHFGLTGMRERADSIGGTLEVTSEPGSGTTVRLQVMTTKEVKERSEE